MLHIQIRKENRRRKREAGREGVKMDGWREREREMEELGQSMNESRGEER